LKIVLGNHDLHALAVAHNLKPAHKHDTLQASIHAHDSAVLFEWLRHQPLMHIQNINGHDYAMVHAGLLPQWTIEKAFTLANEVECALQADNEPSRWHDGLVGIARQKTITNAMTRMRICTENGEMEFEFKGELQDIPSGYMPWFDAPDRQSQDAKIICGHWSALGLQQRENIFALDAGCLWGGQLTAMCLETHEITQVNHDARDRMLRLT
jgi:bis(5'-nucleosyl)-tetraphosphatase (symmetrical)